MKSCLWKAVYLWWKSVKNWQANNWSHASFSLGVWWSTYFFHRLKYNFSLLHVKWQKKQQYLSLSRLNSDQGCLGYSLASETQTLGTSLIELKLWHWKKSDLSLSLFIVALSIIIPDYTALVSYFQELSKYLDIKNKNRIINLNLLRCYFELLRQFLVTRSYLILFDNFLYFLKHIQTHRLFLTSLSWKS